jgi:hypothetical protein
MSKGDVHLRPRVLSISIVLCVAGISSADAEPRTHGLEIFSSGEFVITSKNVAAGLAKTNDQAALRKRWCRPQININRLCA